jgi:FkbM family methyltransferase
MMATNVNGMLQAFKQTPLAWELRRLKRLLHGEPPERAAERRFYTSIIPRDADGCIVDVGANAGSKTELFRQLATRVIAIEPDPISAETLRRRFKWRSNVIVRELAITDHTGSVTFSQFVPGSAFNTADRAWAGAMEDGSNHMHLTLQKPREIQVAACTMAEIETEYWPVKYLKVDAEGHEERVLSTLSHQVPLISLEFNFPQMYGALSTCIEHLGSIGNYRFNVAITEPPTRLELSWLSAAEIIGEITARRWSYAELYARLAQ